MGKVRKERADSLLVQRGLAEDVKRAGALVMAGRVSAGGQRVDKPGDMVSVEAELVVKEGQPFVSRGGIKLSGFLDKHDIMVENRVAMDVGSSTGGFTDCLLKRGARLVYAVDVGKGLIDSALRADPRVRLLEGRNIRYLEASEIGEPPEIIVIDVSFISLTKVLPKVRELMKEGGSVLALVKPQFELERNEVGRGGVVTDPGKHAKAVEKVRAFAGGLGFRPVMTDESPITGTKGNREFWLLLAS